MTYYKNKIITKVTNCSHYTIYFILSVIIRRKMTKYRETGNRKTRALETKKKIYETLIR